MPLSILDTLAASSYTEPDAPAITDANGTTLTWRQMLSEIRKMTSGFREAGLKEGDRVLFAVRPGCRAVVLMIAIADAGGVIVPLDSTMGPALFKSRMELLSPKWAVVESLLLLVSANQWLIRFLTSQRINIPPLAVLRDLQIVCVGRKWPWIHATLSTSALAKMANTSRDLPRPTISDENPIINVFTSGTTGVPKAVVHSWHSMGAVFDTVATLLNFGRDDVIYAHELHLILPALFAGARVVIPSTSTYSPKRTLRDLKNFRVTHLFGVTADFQKLANYLKSRNLTLPGALKEIWIGAAPVRTPFLKDFQTVVSGDTKVWCVYGMTEILPVARVPLSEKIEFDGDGDLVGECVPGVRARISSQGQLLLSGPSLFQGYVGAPPCDELATGDLARIDQGRIVLHGRSKDMIIRRLFNIYPELYEPTIERVAGVKQCAMVGIYDDTVGDERVVLAVEKETGVDADAMINTLYSELRSGPNSIDSSALPDIILVMVLPVSGRSHKVDKEKLRETVRQRTTCV